MSWCPKCKKEFDDDLSMCDDCFEILLKGNKEDYDILLSDSDEKAILSTYSYLIEQGFTSAQYYCDETGVYNLIIHNESFEKAYEAASQFLGDELANIAEAPLDEYEPANKANTEDSSEKIIEKPKKIKPYVNPMDKVNDLSSSAISLLVVGFLGAIFLTLELLNIFSLNLSGVSSIIFYSVMTTLFLVFIVFGIISFINANKLRPLALEEELKTTAIIEFTVANFNKEVASEAIEQMIKDKGITPDDLFIFYNRVSMIKYVINNEYHIEDESYLDYLIDMAYEKIYEDDEAAKQ